MPSTTTDSHHAGAAPRSSEDVAPEIIRVERGELREVYRVRLLADGTASLEPFVNGKFGSGRIFRGGPGHAGFDARAPNSPAKLRAAVTYIAAYLDGSVNVGERDLLSPTSALARNVRWFPGDLQMIHTAFPYVAELFPSAQFHVSQLFRRVLGDVAFLLLVVATSAFWLRTGVPPSPSGLAIALQVLSMMAIVGFDRYWEPLRYRWKTVTRFRWAGEGPRAFLLAPWMALDQLLRGTLSVALATLIGLANLVIHPPRILESWQRVRRGKSLEWKASSVSAGQDMRGWPLQEFLDVYGPAMRLGAAMIAVATWLVILGAPVAILGLNSIGVFAASFLTAALYAWYAALPRNAENGANLYDLSKGERRALVSAGAAGLVFSAFLWHVGLYPMFAFEGSVAIVALFLTSSAAFAIVVPLGLSRARTPARRQRLGSLDRPRWAITATLLITLAVGTIAGSGGLSEVRHWFFEDDGRWRLPPTERRVFADIGAAMRRHGKVDPEPLLRVESDPAILRRPPPDPRPDLGELRGIPSPRLPKLVVLPTLELPDLVPLPLSERLAPGKPQRELLMPIGESVARTPLPALSQERDYAKARGRARAFVPRALTGEEERAEVDLSRRTHFPWIDDPTLARIIAPDETGARIPLAELARAQHWGAAADLWSSVQTPAPTPDRLRLQSLGEAVEGARALGREPTAESVARFLATKSDLEKDWSTRYPHIPLTALRETDGATGRFFHLTRFLLDEKRTKERLAQDLRLDYVDSFFDAPLRGDALHDAFRQRLREEPWERLSIAWDESVPLQRRSDDLQTEQAVATRVWRAAPPRAGDPTPAELRTLATFLDTVLAQLQSEAPPSGYAVFARLLVLEGVDPRALAARDGVATLLASRLWTRTMAGRIAPLVARAATRAPLPGSDADRALLREVARERYPDDGGDEDLRRMLDWLPLVDGVATYRELAAGYDAFAMRLQDDGLRIAGLARAPTLSQDALEGDLLRVWREVPKRWPHLPVREELVGEHLVQIAYFSSRDGHAPRTLSQFLDDFGPLLGAVDARMDEAPPPAVLRLATRAFEGSQQRVLESAPARRFLAWLSVASQARVLAHNRARHGLRGDDDLASVATRWNDVLTSGEARWPHLPWTVPGFAEFFVHTGALEGWSLDELWQRFGGSLATADDLLARHVVPFQAFEAIVERRIEERTGAPNFDPTLRQANAVLALAKLLEVLHANGIHRFDGNPAQVTEAFALLHEALARSYPHLYWDGEGSLEFYLLVELVENADLVRLKERFHPEWALADALAAGGLRARFDAIAASSEAALVPEDRPLRVFLDTQARRLEERTGSRDRNPLSRSGNGLVALASLLLSAGEEGLLPLQNGEPWTQRRTKAWAASLGPGGLSASDVAWAEGLAREWGALLGAMREEGPRFPWHKGSIVETELLLLRGTGLSVEAARPRLADTWKADSDLVERGVRLPTAFDEAILREAIAELRPRIARARGIPAEAVADEELVPEDPDLVRLQALAVVGDLVAQIRKRYGEDPAPVFLADRVLEMRAEGPRRYPFLPWTAKGFIPSLVVGSYQPELRADVWAYLRFLELPSVNALLGELDEESRHGSGAAVPADARDDVRAILRQQTGRTPSSEDVVVFQALLDGSAILRDLVPRAERTATTAVAVVRLRAAVRALDRKYPALHLLATADRGPRVGFTERLAAIAFTRAQKAGLAPSSPTFVPDATAGLEREFLTTMNEIYARVRESFLPEELRYHRESIRAAARVDNLRRAARFGLAASSLEVPEVLEDDIVADFALYEILYAAEIGQGRDYLENLFSVFAMLRRRPDVAEGLAAGLRTVDAPYRDTLRSPDEEGYDTWLADARYGEWLERRGELLQRERGRLVALSRAFALLHAQAFAPESDAAARRAFDAFGSFEHYVATFFDAFEAVRRVPEIASAIDVLEREDPFLGDGVRFALALFQVHVVDGAKGAPALRGRVLPGMGIQLPRVLEDYRRVLGFTPRLESGVPFFDARMAFLRSEIQSQRGTTLLRRLDLMQRSTQRWPETYFVKHAYKVLFHWELDEDDDTPAPRPPIPGFFGPLWAMWPAPTVGQRVTTFLETHLPATLEAQTGSRDVIAWIDWLAQHGEIDLDGVPTGTNSYAEDVASYETRLAHYRRLVDEGTAAGRSVKAEEQRIRDLERERSSLERQVRWLHDAAVQSRASLAIARRDYTDAIWFHGVLAAIGIAVVVGLARALLHQGRAALIVGALAALVVVGAPALVAAFPARVALAEPLLSRLRLLERDEDNELRLRGAAAQLAKSRPWQTLVVDAKASGSER